MPVAPKPYKLVCPNCGYSKIVKPKSDTDIIGMMPLDICPKCNSKMEKTSLSKIDEIIGMLKN